MHLQQQSRLLQLPTELQLVIFEYAVVETAPLLINCGCDSSYFGDDERWQQDLELWESGEKHPPTQPALTRTCRLIRNIALPMYYQQNSFRAHYCFPSDFDGCIKWVEQIGSANRRLLRYFCLWDKNSSYDQWTPEALAKVKRSAMFQDLGGSMETLEVIGCCCHRITFGDEGDDYYEFVRYVFG